MKKAIVMQRNCYLKAGMKLIAASSMMVYILLLCLAPPVQAVTTDTAGFRQISWPEIESLLSKRSFVSKEELFQVLHRLYLQQQDMIRLDKPVIQKLAGTIESLFPLDACEMITLGNGTVNMTFSKPQDIYIPNSWHQASLRISQHLVLRLEDARETKSQSRPIKPVENDTQSLRFIIEQGYLKLDFSFLLRIFGNSLRDGQGSELLYKINHNKQISSLALIEKTLLTQRDLSINKRQPSSQTDAYSWINILHSDFPDTKDIGISANKMFFLGMDVELLPNERIRFGDDEPLQDRAAYYYFKASLAKFKDFVFSKGKAIAIDYTRTFGYHFEEGKMSFFIGLQTAKGNLPIM